ncbi:MAG TPA: glycosyltransferase [Gemmataceae bacterium]|nr:glycosyltransferase [Gemmataceae bacterium]
MIRILFVIPSLDYCGAATQLSLLATGLPRSLFEISVCALDEGGPLALRLRNAGVAVHELGWRRWFDLRPYWRFRECVSRFAPDIIHAWTTRALYMLPFARKTYSRLVVTAASLHKRSTLQNRLDLRLLRRADRMVVATCAEAERGQQLGVACERLVAIASGVQCPAAHEQPEKSLHRFLRLKDSDRLIVCVGPLQPHKGFYEAIWAFDILHYLYDNLRLVVVGDGPDRGRLEEFVRHILGAGSVHLIGRQPEVLPLLSQAEVVWVPSRTGGGVNVALEAMAAGRPVVASRVRDLAEVIHDGVGGLLVPPGDKVALARQTRLLLDDPVRARRLGAAARQRVLKEFAAANVIERHTDLYQSVLKKGSDPLNKKSS